MEEARKRQVMKQALAKLEQNRYVYSEETLKFAQDVFLMCQELDYKEGMAFADLIKGRLYNYLNDYQNAMTYSFDAIDRAQELNICDLQVMAYLNMGSVFFDMDDFEKSLDYYNTALRIMGVFKHSKNYFSEFSADYYLAKIYNDIGEVYRLHDLLEEASEFYRMAYEYDKKNFEATFGVVLTNLGYVEFHLQNYDKAISHLKEAMKYLNEFHYDVGLVEAYDLLAMVNQQMGDLNLAEESYAKARDYASKIEYSYAKVELALHYAKFLEDNENYTQAIDVLHVAYNLSEESQLFNQSLSICRYLIRLCEMTNRNQEAIEYYKLYFELLRSQEPVKQKNKKKRFEMKLKLDRLEIEKKDIIEKSEQVRKETKELSEAISQIAAIGEIGSKLTTSTELPIIYQMIWSAILELLAPNIFGIGLIDEESGCISYPFYMENNRPIVFKSTNITDEASMAAKCLRENRVIIVDDLQNEYLTYLEDTEYIAKNNCYEINSVLFCPLVIDKQRIGVMTIQSYQKNFFSVYRIVSIQAYASYAAIAINNSIKSNRLTDEVEKRKYLQRQLESSNKQLSYLSEHDALTGLPNKRKFEQVIRESLASAIRDNEFLAVALFDIDFFKQYNDTYGHTEGDTCLYMISNLAQKAGGDEAFISRFGGDEFVIVIKNETPQRVKEICEKIRAEIENSKLEHLKSEIQSVVTITMGAFCKKPTSADNTSDFIIKADRALYEAKKEGRNRVVCHENIEE